MAYRVPVYLGLSEIRPGFSKRDVEEVQHLLGHIDTLPIELANMTVFPEGHAAGLKAFQIATDHI